MKNFDEAQAILARLSNDKWELTERELGLLNWLDWLNRYALNN